MLLVWLVVSAVHRKAEHEADAYAVEKTNFSSGQVAGHLAVTVKLLPVLSRPIVGLVPRFLVTHPVPKKRIQAIINH